MTLAAAERFFALLTVAALAGVLVCLVGRLVPSAALRGWTTLLRVNRVLLAAIVADTAMVGSLYFSEVGHLTPCLFCWYQRCLMYPLAIILTVAAVRRDQAVRPFAIALAGVGVLVSAYHYALEWIHSLDTGACSVSVPCTFVYFRQFGFMSLAFMAMSGFLFILTLFTLPGESS
jgi:disulfide bond formation protein DsbB